MICVLFPRHYNNQVSVRETENVCFYTRDRGWSGVQSAQCVFVLAGVNVFQIVLLMAIFRRERY